METVKITYSARQLQRLVVDLDGVTLDKRKLTQWAQRGILVPSHWAKRCRVERHYTIAEVRRCRLIVNLRKQGISMQVVKRALAYLDQYEPSVFARSSRATLNIVNGAVYLHRDGQPDVAIPEAQTRFQFDLSTVATQRGKLKKYANA